MDDKQRYWATADVEELPDEMLARVRAWWEFLEATGRFDLWRRSNRLYYGLDADGGWSKSAAVTFGGEQGETTEVRINEYRSLLDHSSAMVTATRPAMDARAINADAESMAQARIANGLLEFYMTEQHLEEKAINALRFALRFGEAGIVGKWDPDAGEIYTVEELPPAEGDEEGAEARTKTTYQGDLRAIVLHPRDIIRDPAHEGVKSHRWMITHMRKSRWDLAAQYGDTDEAREEILAAPSVPDVSAGRMWDQWTTGGLDEVSVFELYHEKCPALPEGRYAMMVGSTLLFEGPLPYEQIPVIMVAPDEELDTPCGYTTAFDMMGPQAALDSTVSTILSNHESFGLQHVWTQKGSGLEVSDIGGGLKHWEANTKPEAVQLTAISGDSYKVAEIFTDAMQKLSGINSVARGDAEGVTSGSMAALIHSMAAQYLNPLQRAYGGLLEALGTHLVQVMQRYATTPRLIDISGVRGRPMLREFKGEDIGKVRRVVVDLGNAMMRTSAGRQHVAELFLERQAITPQQYLEIVSTGRLEPLTDRENTRRRGLSSENEMLIEGTIPRVLITDMHPDHISEHLSLLDEPSIREDDAIAGAILDHINSHIEIWQTVPPQMQMALKIPAPPMAMPMGPPPPMPPAPGGNPGGGQNAPPPEAPPMSVDGAGVPDVNMPSMPTMPGGGESYDPNAGAMQ